MKVTIKKWKAVAAWTWDVGEVGDEETCGICYNPFDGCCPDCRVPGDDCPLGLLSLLRTDEASAASAADSPPPSTDAVKSSKKKKRKDRSAPKAPKARMTAEEVEEPTTEGRRMASAPSPASHAAISSQTGMAIGATTEGSAVRLPSMQLHVQGFVLRIFEIPQPTLSLVIFPIAAFLCVLLVDVIIILTDELEVTILTAAPIRRMFGRDARWGRKSWRKVNQGSTPPTSTNTLGFLKRSILRKFFSRACVAKRVCSVPQDEVPVEDVWKNFLRHGQLAVHQKLAHLLGLRGEIEAAALAAAVIVHAQTETVDEPFRSLVPAGNPKPSWLAERLA
ncbi:hypothetical protein PhCBS80983_g03216 [Powellomyces hirtus]|uniref:Anaphase-promoting complex subunit 11 RING-H2 finger domain-containing protein n=1 Tax=Powellomyces hirtus TaxID=109895 RepID=A0A507E2L1_9FUNG|nr:hypothetical protein PhCBS80983_g03216 [Powellomyces hirtus]